MEKAVQIFENKKEICLTTLAILVTGLLRLDERVFVCKTLLIVSGFCKSTEKSRI